MRADEIKESVHILDKYLVDFLKAYSQSRGIDFKLDMAKVDYQKKNGFPMAEITEAKAIESICQEVKFDKIIKALKSLLSLAEEYLKVDGEPNVAEWIEHNGYFSYNTIVKFANDWKMYHLKQKQEWIGLPSREEILKEISNVSRGYLSYSQEDKIATAISELLRKG
jgi:hypothetical protein